MNILFEWVVSFFQNVKLWTVVCPWELAVRVRVGKYTAVLSPGWHWKLPFVDAILVINTRLRISPDGFQSLTTKDGKTITVSMLFGFRIIDPLEALMNFQRPEGVYSAMVMEAASEYITSHTLNEITVPKLEKYIFDKLEKINNGVQIAFVRVNNYALPRVLRIVNDSWTPNTGDQDYSKLHSSGVTYW